MRSLKYCHSNPEELSTVIEGDCDEYQAVVILKNIDWGAFIGQFSAAIDRASEGESITVPFISFSNEENSHSIHYTPARDQNDNWKILVIYQRTKKIKAFFGLKEKTKTEFTGDKLIDESETLTYLDSFVRNNVDLLEKALK